MDVFMPCPETNPLASNRRSSNKHIQRLVKHRILTFINNLKISPRIALSELMQ